MEIVYIDSYFFLNLLADYLLCLCAGRICGLRLKRTRYFLAALFGAFYAAASLFPGLSTLSLPFFRLAAGLLMGLIAFGAEQTPLRCTAVLLGVSAGFGGALWALSLTSGGGGAAYLDLKTLLLAFALCYGAGSLFFRGRGRLPERPRVPVQASFLGRTAELTALVDTGNSLSDPATGAPVMIVCPQALRPIFQEDTALFSLPPVELMEQAARTPALKGKLRLIPYTAVGVSGLLPAFRPELLLVDGKPDKEHLIAVSSNAVGDGFDAVI